MSVRVINSNDETVLLPQETGNEELDNIVEIAGYSYDPKQDIFYSNMDPWQRGIGYCRLYDEAAAPLGMIIDCEPIYFEYGGKKWMIALWKGQYDLVTGCEIGVYTGTLDLKIPGFLRGAFYHCASNDDLLQMSYTLIKNNKPYFTREGTHWWLTGFRLGEFSEPSELMMDVKITLKNVPMCEAFVIGLRNAGYSDDEFTTETDRTTVSFKFGVPHTRQPITRTPTTDWFIQRKNEQLCIKYQEITKTSTTMPDKIKAIEEQAPELYGKIMRFGKSKALFEIFETSLLVIIVTGMLILSQQRAKHN
ncbi:DUF4474 domain-containing protein [Desulfosporosinus metallidurans]|uniref:DUF4474 domain-containing protein n=1 Tax=Desulfosporosinus metallidurans TaxID=1888891 RepID=A0A1Q8QW13_9FIRM|nr:DUF4474 domain-containing protein [Desulfosporosinus metallidurans]OLN31510.1 hypothetical protein DSOL_2535 [Desulfosporosinus metallidurans]